MTEAAAVKARDPSVGGSGKQWGQETIDRGGGGGGGEKGDPTKKGGGRGGGGGGGGGREKREHPN